jgi:hypothetical protein
MDEHPALDEIKKRVIRTFQNFDGEPNGDMVHKSTTCHLPRLPRV